MRNKSSKGFTLIELLVVVAIIGILAAVGVVAYNGYTKSAKKSASASNHASVVKYVAAELAKCGIESTGFGTWDCSNKSKTDGDSPSNAAVAALSDFKNPFDTSSNAVTASATVAASALKGNTVVSNTSTTVTVSTCTVDGCAAADIKTNTIAID